MGDTTLVSFFGGDSSLEALNPFGELTFRFDGRRFVGTLTGALYDTGRFFGRAVWLHDRWHIVAGNTLYELHPETSLSVRESEDPAVSATIDVFPNPFHRRATVEVVAERMEKLEIDLYDALGRRVASLFEGYVSPGDRRTFALEGDDLASGLYLIRVRGESWMTTIRATLLK